MDSNKLILKPGLEGVPVTNSSICDIDGNKGKLLYRGYSIEELSKKSSFLETAYLLIWGELPTAIQLRDFEQSFFKDFIHIVNQNILILNSKKDWLITFEKNTEDQFDLSALKKIKDFNKYTLKQKEDIYSIYSKDILEEKDDVIKQLTYENIYSIESGGLQIISNHLIDGKKLEKISKKFFNLKSNKDKSTFLYSKVDIKNGNSNKIEYLSNLQDLNFLIRNILKISNEESLEIISQSIPEKNPILYIEKSLKIF